MAGLTRSQSLFSKYMGLDVRVLVIGGSDEVYLFMDLRTERRWALNASKNIEHIPKHPRALMEQLGSVETKIATQVACNNFTYVYISHLKLPTAGTDTFWR
ncbi:hypothetical protein BC827DRAFT_1249395 [Russula dissimulans]|nr:hypothetical protein BC827DRAFT_1249395 [Russula dissimulans]